MRVKAALSILCLCYLVLSSLLVSAGEPDTSNVPASGTSSLFLPMIVLGSNPKNFEDRLGTIHSAEQLRTFMEAAGRPEFEISLALERYHDALSSLGQSGKQSNPEVTSGYSLKELNCSFGTGAMVIFFSATGAWTSTWHTNHGNFPITQWCQGYCVHDRTYIPWSGWQRVYSHSLIGNSVGHLAGWCL